MGYETRMYIGRVLNECKRNYFLRMAELDLCKCCYGHFGELIESSVSRGFPVVYWSNSFTVNQEEVLEQMEKDQHYLWKEWGDDETKDVVEELSEIFEGWESEVSEDLYGCELVAIPIQEVYDAMAKDQAEKPYRRFTIGLAMLKGFIDTFEEYEEIHVVLFGH